ncbi:PREDICTED: serine/threonine-protein phosphatase 6 regulatory ankyrin repeat subunit A-like [Amphimedon queenslandica]|uniref:Uncharacterized protein n=1 Tax=Amphimedon queenslandica TaxID=400682 RepID=A0AAN0IRQ6_AMPQE|nr:PREDICTED: serine/threonine-protein phosphatase 6 regulatory ankyrin repeat subunit A-like [Amphimedon queenslandica]|eukprot:XP_011408388.1 PREDICTED: serine/threonine-protein phosphatase 6 regulatory ankyrin repeat subunit A-like [Amphimedon queenslandica]
MSGNMKLVQYLINNYQLSLTSIALLLAVYSTKLSLIKLFVNEYKLDPRVKDVNSKQAVYCTAQVGTIDALEYLVKDCGCDLNRVDGARHMNVFHYSTSSGHFSFIKYIINNYPQYTSLLHSTDDNDALPIHAACGSGVIQLVTFLIDVMKCDATTQDKDVYNCISHACTSGNLDLLKLLIKQYNLNPRIYSLKSSTEIAVTYRHVHILEWLRQEYHINVASFKKGVLPFYAAQYSNLYCLKHLLNNYSFDINATYPFDDTQSTLLHIACQEGHVAIVLYLTSLPQLEEHQFDLTIKDYNGMAPVHVACEEGSLSIVKYIIDHSPLSLDMTDSFGRTPLLIAAFSKNLPIIRYLNSKKCNISILDDKGFNIIHISAKRGSLDILRFFVDGRYCNPDITDASGRTPLYLLDPESEDKDGVTCLHIIAKQGDKEIYEYLVPRVRNNPTPKDKAGRSPLHYASRHYEISVYLIQCFNIHPEDKDSNGFTGVHAACQAGNIQLVSHYLTNLKCDKNILTNSSKGLLYFAGRSGNLELVHILIDKFDLVPVQGDIDGARSVNAESTVKFLEARISLSKLVRELVDEAEKRQLVAIATKPRPSFLSS